MDNRTEMSTTRQTWQLTWKDDYWWNQSLYSNGKDNIRWETKTERQRLVLCSIYIAAFSPPLYSDFPDNSVTWSCLTHSTCMLMRLRLANQGVLIMISHMISCITCSLYSVAYIVLLMLIVISWITIAIIYNQTPNGLGWCMHVSAFTVFHHHWLSAAVSCNFHFYCATLR